jgi:hypothetical protein
MSGVEGLAALGIPVVLGSFATVVFPVVAHDPHCPDPRIVVQRGRVLVGLRRSGVLPGYDQNQVTGREYGVEDIPGRAVSGPRVQAEPLGAVVRIGSLLPFAGRVELISVTVVPSPTSVSSSLCSVRAYPVGT